jgi:hypothetical protein
LVLLIMARRLPDLYLHVGGTHVHHLNYGIFVLAVVGAVLLFAPPSGRWRDVVAALYGAGLALTFDEFGMWLHLGGSYWQRASFDAVTVVGGLLLLFAYTPPAAKWTRRGIVDALLVLALLGVFFWQLSVSLTPLAQRALPTLERIEQQGPR